MAVEGGFAAWGVDFSGEMGYIDSEMWWPITHMVAPAEQSLQCTDCHDPQGRLDFAALGYDDGEVQALTAFPPGEPGEPATTTTTTADTTTSTVADTTTTTAPEPTTTTVPATTTTVVAAPEPAEQSVSLLPILGILAIVIGGSAAAYVLIRRSYT